MYMSDNQPLVQTIKEWITLEDKIAALSKELRDMRKQKKMLTERNKKVVMKIFMEDIG